MTLFRSPYRRLFKPLYRPLYRWGGSSAPPIEIPVNISPPVIDPEDGGAGTTINIISSGSWDPAPDNFEYRWKLNWVVIPGETGDFYIVGAEANGDIITAEVRTRLTGGSWSSWVSSNSFEYDAGDPPSYISGGTISGGTELDAELTATDPTWSNDPTSTSREWEVNETPTGETGTTYDDPREDGDSVTCVFYASNAAGSATPYRSNAIVAEDEPDEPVISGFAFPGETLSSTVSGQWTVDGSPVSTGSTYQVQLEDIGLDIQCEDSNVLTCWHPRDVSQVKSCRVPWSGVLNSVGPDVDATVGQTVRRWTDIISGYTADQTTGANQPILREANGMRYVEGDGSDDILTITGQGENGAFRNVGYGGIVAAVRDRTPAAGTAGHLVYGASTTSSVSARLVVLTRDQNITHFAVSGRRLDADSYSNLATTSNSNHIILSGVARFADGNRSLFINGSNVANRSFPSGAGSTSNTDSNTIALFGLGTTNYAPSDLYCQIAWSGSSNLTLSDHSRLQRFAMLCMGSNYTGADIPLIPPTDPSFDEDAKDYINRIESADGEPLEDAVKDAMNELVLDIKAGGEWRPSTTRLTVSAGAKTFAGAMVPLLGAALTNRNFVSGDWTRTGGLKGNASDKDLVGANSNLWAQDNYGVFVWQTEDLTIAGRSFFGDGTTNGASQLYRTGSGTLLGCRSRSNLTNTNITGTDYRGVGMLGLRRISSTDAIVDDPSGASVSVARASQSPINANMTFFSNAGTVYTDSGLSVFHQGEDYNRSVWVAALTKYHNAIAAALP